MSEDLDRCYRTLGLEPGTSWDDVKQAYRDLVRVWHPDRFSHDPRLQRKAEDKLREINAAYERLQLARDGAGSEPSTRPPGTRESRTAPGSGASAAVNAPRGGAERSSPEWRRPVLALVLIGLVVTVLAVAFIASRRDGERASRAQGSRSGEDSAQAFFQATGDRARGGVGGRVSLPTGTNIVRPRGPHGLGELEVANGTDRDAVVRLVDGSGEARTRRFVYIGSGDRITISAIGPGTYRLRFGLGLDWDNASRHFTRDRAQYESEDLQFVEERGGDGDTYTSYTVSLHKMTRETTSPEAANPRSSEKFQAYGLISKRTTKRLASR